MKAGIKKIFGKVVNTIKYRLERFILGGLKNQLLFLAGLIVVISIVSGYLHYTLYPEVKFDDSIWWAFLRLSDPGYLGDDKGLARRVISTIVTILGYVVFMGSLVAIMAKWLNSTIKKLELGMTPISIKGHILILGWTNRTPIIVREIMLSEEKVSRFLKLIKRSKLHIVVLADEVNTAKVQDLKDKLGPLWDKDKIILRSGSPLNIDHLLRVDFLNASVIIMPGANFAYGGSDSVDVRAIKVMMTISNHAEQDGQKCPDFITEIFDLQKLSVVNSVYSGNVEAISSNLLISRLITQNVMHKGISRIVAEILNDEGNEIYMRQYPEFVGMWFFDIKKYFTKAIVIGLIRNNNGEEQVLLSPSENIKIREDDQVVLLAEYYKDIDLDYTSEDFTLTGNKIEIIQVAREAKKLRLLIIGWNHKVPSILTEFDKYEKGHITIDIFSVRPVDERSNLLYTYNVTLNNVTLNHVIGNSTVLNDFKQIDICSYNTVLMLANDWLASSEEADARTIMGYNFITGLLKNKENSPNLIVELMDTGNKTLFQHSPHEVIVSPLLLSYALSQIALRKGLRVIFDEMFSSGGSEIYLQSPDVYGLLGKELTFHEIEEVIASYGDTALGMVSHRDDKDVCLNPKKDSVWYLTGEDEVIVLT